MIRLKNTTHNKFAADKPGKRLHSNEAGYTILESIVAMVVVAVLMTAVAPVIVFAGATRLQARRVELATQAARTYMDGVKSGAIAAPQNSIVLTATSDRTTDFVNKAGAPAPSDLTGDCTTKNGYCNNNTLYCVNLDDTPGCQSDSLRDMVVQGFRSAVSTSDPDDYKQGYLLGVRVYRANSFQSGITLGTKLPSTTVTNALGSRGLPLVTMTTEISPSDAKQGFANYCRRLNTNCQL